MKRYPVGVGKLLGLSRNASEKETLHRCVIAQNDGFKETAVVAYFLYLFAFKNLLAVI